ncbi:MAG: hypothetical protein L0215_12610 [Gemmataceae bacterium]|nr:hypothetical protein [Gemmataceae bacterium]
MRREREPVWIKYYGLVPMTKRGYLIALTVAGGTAVVFCLVATVLG